MRRFSTEEVLAIMSDDHRYQTAWAMAKATHEVTATDLVVHWLEHHIVPVLTFNVEPKDEEQGWLFT